jgi:hypothetical protein
MRKFAVVLVALVAAACASTPSGTPEERFAALERRLDAAPEWSMAFDASTTGAVESRFNGNINVLTGNIASIDADGLLRGNETHVRWRATGSPAQVGHAITIGVLRLGVTHDIVVLAGGAKTIENAEGGIEQALRLTGLAWDAKEKKFTYHLLVNGQETGTGELWVGRGDMSLRRKLTAHFPNGDMHVDERYTWR